MHQPNTWAIIGPEQGLGPAILRYLLSRHQRVIAISCDETPTPVTCPDQSNLINIRLVVTPDTITCDGLPFYARQYGPIHTLVDNHRSLPVLRLLLPYMATTNGKIIIPPPATGYNGQLSAELRTGHWPQTISAYFC